MRISSSVIAFIPARAGSKSINRKNLAMVGQNSLLEWAVKAAFSSSIVEEIVVSSDSEEILDLAATKVKKDFSDQSRKLILHERSEELASDNSKIMETISEFHRSLSKSRRNSAILMLQPTSPFRKVNEVDQFLKFAIDGGKWQPTVSVRRVEDCHPARMYRMKNDNTLEHCNFLSEEEFYPRQELSHLYLRDGAYYLITQDMVKAFRPVDKNCRAFKREFPFTINIDHQSDLLLAQHIFESIKNEV